MSILRQPLYFPEAVQSDEDQLEAICSGCNYKYRLVSAQVLGFASEVETLLANECNKQPSHRRIYELRLLTISRELKALRLQTLGLEERISALPRDEMLLLYTI